VTAWPPPARPGNPAVACTAATVPRLAGRSARPGLRRVTPPVPQGRSCGRGWRCRGYSVGGPWWWQPGRGLRRRWLVVAVLAAITRHRGCTWPRGAQQKRPTDAVIRTRAARTGADASRGRREPPGPGPPGPGPPARRRRQPARAQPAGPGRETWILAPGGADSFPTHRHRTGRSACRRLPPAPGPGKAGFVKPS